MNNFLKEIPDPNDSSGCPDDKELMDDDEKSN